MKYLATVSTEAWLRAKPDIFPLPVKLFDGRLGKYINGKECLLFTHHDNICPLLLLMKHGPRRIFSRSNGPHYDLQLSLGLLATAYLYEVDGESKLPNSLRNSELKNRFHSALLLTIDRFPIAHHEGWLKLLLARQSIKADHGQRQIISELSAPDSPPNTSVAFTPEFLSINLTEVDLDYIIERPQDILLSEEEFNGEESAPVGFTILIDALDFGSEEDKENLLKLINISESMLLINKDLKKLVEYVQANSNRFLRDTQQENYKIIFEDIDDDAYLFKKIPRE